MSFTQTLQGAWDWIRKINWLYMSFLAFGVSGILLVASDRSPPFLCLESVRADFGRILGIVFLIAGVSLFWHGAKWSWGMVRTSSPVVSFQIKRNMSRLGQGSKRILRTMYQDADSSMRLSKESAELEILLRIGFIHCGRYIINGFVECELNGAVVNWLSNHEGFLESLPEPEDVPF